MKEYDFVTNVDKIFWPKEKYTKGDVIVYYHKIAPYILPYLKDRPESLKRQPDGIKDRGFFQKNITTAPAWVKTAKVQHSDKVVRYLLIQDEKSLIYAANLGCIELNPLNARIQSLDKPDYLIFDLDPVEISYDKVVETAQAIHETLKSCGVPSFPKTSGATGMHIYVPMGAKYPYDIILNFAKMIAEIVHSATSSFTSLERMPAKRRKKVYIDIGQNNAGQTLAAVYSLRSRPGAPVSTPLEWSEVKAGLTPEQFNMKNIFKRLDKKGDLFKPVLKKGINLKAVLSKCERL